MARKIKFSKEDILKGGISFVKEYGEEKLCARDVAAYIGCSTQPIFKNYKNFFEFKLDIKKELYNEYKIFINNMIDKNHYLFSISYAYALFAKQEKNVFKFLFNSDLSSIRTIEDIKNAIQNQVVINYTIKEFDISLKDAEELFINIRFFTHGIATQLSIGTLKIDDESLKKLIEKTIITLLGGMYEKDI